VLTSNNRLIAWGYGETGQIVGNSFTDSPKDITSSFTLNTDEVFTHINLGFGHSSFVTSEHRVFMMGDNRSGQIGNNYNGGSFSRNPVDITGNISSNLGPVTEAYLAFEHSLLFSPSNGDLYSFGSNSNGQLGINSFGSSIPVKMSNNIPLDSSNKVISVKTGYKHNAALSSDNQLYVWGFNGWGEITINTANSSQQTPINITNNLNLFENETITDFSLGGGTSGQGSIVGAHTGIVTSLGRVFMFGSNQFGQLGNGSTTTQDSINSNLTPVSGLSVSFDPTITFDSNGGGSIDSITQASGTTILAPAAPSRVGYVFDGWYIDSELINAYTFTTMPNEDTTLYAKWSLQTYYINYELDGGTNNLSNPETFNIDTPTITLEAPTKNGYTFMGWYDNSNFIGTLKLEIPAGTTLSQTLYAKFEINQYTITFDSNGGSLVSSITQDYNTNVVAPAAPSR